MRPREQPRDAMTRELREETGLDMQFGDPAVTYVQHGRRHIDHVFVVEAYDEPQEPTGQAPIEIAESGWWRFDRLPPLQSEARAALLWYRDSLEAD